MRLAICDDSRVLRAVFTRLCRGLGHDVVAACADLESAVAIVRSSMPDAIVIDGRLATEIAPAIRALRDASPTSDVFVLASIDERALIVAAREAGAVGAVRRPFTRSDLLAAFGTCACEDASNAANANESIWQKAPS